MQFGCRALNSYRPLGGPITITMEYNRALPIGDVNFLAEHYALQCMAKVLLGWHEFGLYRLRIVRMWILDPRPRQRNCASNSNHTLQKKENDLRLVSQVH